MAPGPMQILIIALVILLLFGASRLSDIGKGLGEGIRNFKKGVSDDSDDGKKGERDKDDKQLSAKELGSEEESPAKSEKKEA
ncbi:MAG TPA: twin-arginine translocase TatA/TatE family subunit [Polyangiaceae bacterium]|jgi:sec-independent protein translocase protein TatA